MQYELVVVVDPIQEAKTIEDKLKALMIREGFTVGEVTLWGKKPLAYPLRKKTEGLFFLFNITSAGSNPKLLHRAFKLEESVLRALITRKEMRKKN